MVPVREIREINLLWKPVIPYLADFVLRLCGGDWKSVADVGPFLGISFELAKRKAADEFFVLSFPKGAEVFFKEQAELEGIQVKVLVTDPSFRNVEDESFDFLFFRGAFFFPEIFKVDFSALMRILRRGGRAVLGGGYGILAPMDVVATIKDKSRDLNKLIGKVDLKIEDLEELVRNSGVREKTEFIFEGGLWMIIRK